ncbi:MAG: hypothetical protein IT285_03550 [Bdellovibrionales bacterium]|nr:hypothetical protein [Bdellovibrionales bacterium]
MNRRWTSDSRRRWAALSLGAAACAFASCSLDEPVDSLTCGAEFTSTTSVALGLNDTSAGDELAQSFELDETATFTKARLFLARVGAPGSTIQVSFQANLSGEPAGTDINSAIAEISPDDISSSTYTTFTLDTSITLTAGTTYWLVLKANYPASAANYVEWQGAASDEFDGGQAKEENAGGTAFAASGSLSDFAFGAACQ